MRLRNWLVWTLALISIVASVIEIVRGFDETGNVVMALVPAAFAVAGALVATKQPENIVGFLMMTIGAGSAIAGLIGVYLTSFDSPPPIPVFVTLFLVLLNGWGWLYLIFPIFHMLLVFPSGKLLSPRWRWLVGLEVAMLAVFVGVTMLAREVGPTAQDEYVWVMQNPIGVFDTSTEESIFGGVWSIGLVTLALGGLAAMVIRFRRTTGSERQQIKWLLYAFVIFAVVYAITAAASDFLLEYRIVDLVFGLAILGIPIAMTAAILRYRLFDIDLLIRKTLLYVVVTGLLGSVYVGSVFLTRDLFGRFATSSLSVAVSTLLVAALFNPVRRRLQKVIDRRLFRTRYNAEQVLDRVASSFRLQTDIGSVSGIVLEAVQETMHPTSLGLWVKDHQS